MTQLYIALNGNDRWSGRLSRPNAGRNDGPLATFEGALRRIGALKEAGQLDRDLYVDIRGEVFPCIGCVGQGEPLSLGNIRTQKLAKIWNNTKRVLLRDHLDEIVFGPCAWCQNFQNTCWSCLGRAVERFEVTDDQLALHTRGCFNHRPDWGKWVQRLDQLMDQLVDQCTVSEKKPSSNSRKKKVKVKTLALYFFPHMAGWL